MSDSKSNTSGQDRSRVAADQPYEVAYFAERHGIDQATVLEIIRQHGPSRAACDDAAEKARD